MTKNGSPGIWSILSVVIAGVGGLLMILLAHADQPTHSESAHEDTVHALAVRLEGVSVEVDHTKVAIGEIQEDVAALRAQQRQSTEQIIRAIREERND